MKLPVKRAQLHAVAIETASAVNDLLGTLDSLMAIAVAAERVAALHQAGGDEWWDAHTKMYEALRDLGVEVPYAS